MLVLGVFIPIVQVTNDAANSVRSRVLVDVYMKTKATAADEARVRRELLAVPHVRNVQFVSKEQAFAQQSKLDPSRLQAARLKPAAGHLPRDPGQARQRAGGPQRAHARANGQPGTIDPSIQTVSNKKNDTKKILEVTNLVTITRRAL